ncbi:MAG: xanthine dehydrogenase family protein molybdopterin-binding subunit [Acidimicrobiales bacterium]
MSILGTRVLRTEDPRFLTVGGTYTADVDDPLLAGALHVTFVRSTMAHADITIDVEDARAMPGVAAVLTEADIGLAPQPCGIPLVEQAMVRPFLASERVRFVGEPIAAVVTETPEQGADAAEAVFVDYQPLPAVIDPEEAVNDEIIVHEAAGTNLAAEMSDGRTTDLFDGCEVVIDQRIVNNRVNAAPLEVRGAAAVWDGAGKLHLWASTQNAHGVLAGLQAFYGLERSEVRVVTPDVGGGFGAKIGVHPEENTLPAIARIVGRPVRWTETRSENMVAMGHGRAQVQLVEMGGTRDGTIEAYSLSVLQDAGAYPDVGAFLPYLTRTMAAGTYAIPKVECTFTSVATNTTPIIAYRGAGRPEACAAIERAVDLFAAEVGLDAAEVRRRNLIAKFDEPYVTPMGTAYDCGDYGEALDRVLAAADYDELRAEQARRRAAGDVKALGIGVSCYVEVTAGPFAGSEHAKIEVHADGSATVFTGSSPHGQGHATSFAMIASDTTGIAMERIEVVWGDTDRVEKGEGTMGSRSLQLGGSAVLGAATSVIERAKALAADELEAALDDVVLDVAGGRFHVRGVPAKAKSWGELAGAAGAEGLAADDEFQAPSTTFPFGAHVAVVEVDLETGATRLVRFVACDDAGRLLNPLLVDGQRHGGIAQGVGQALYEEVLFDADGNPQTANFADYGLPTAAELPDFELVAMETPTWANPLGAKGVGESGAIGATPAVQSAVCDAVAHLGVRHVDIPCTPERVWQAISDATART